MPSQYPKIHIVRNSESMHNIDHNYPSTDPSLTPTGKAAAKLITLPSSSSAPSLILVSPTTRTLETALHAFPSLLSPSPRSPRLEIWPDLREAHNSHLYTGLRRTALIAVSPTLASLHPDAFSSLPEEWDSPPHSLAEAGKRAERVRGRLRELVSGGGGDVVVVTHGDFAAFLVQGKRFETGEMRSYRVLEDGKKRKGGEEVLRRGWHCETGEEMDFGPDVLVPAWWDLEGTL